MNSFLVPEEIHLWCADYSALCDEETIYNYRRLLTGAEMEQEQKFYFARDQRRYLMTRALLRTVLSRYAPIAPRDWTFQTNPYGRPHISNKQSEAAKISFNISHTNSLIVIGVTHTLTLGVDTENHQATRSTIGITQYFSTEEASALDRLPEDRRQQRFYEYWTLKESYIKARGMGLSIPLDSFSFTFQNNNIDFYVHPDQGDTSNNWNFLQLEIEGTYVLALCVQSWGNRIPELKLKKVTPLMSEQALDYRILRVSRRN